MRRLQLSTDPVLKMENTGVSNLKTISSGKARKIITNFIILIPNTVHTVSLLAPICDSHMVHGFLRIYFESHSNGSIIKTFGRF